jgi:hypothetical protein
MSLAYKGLGRTARSTDLKLKRFGAALSGHSDLAALGQRHRARSRDDEVVQKSDVHQRQGVLQVAGEGQVGFAGFSNA